MLPESPILKGPEKVERLTEAEQKAYGFLTARLEADRIKYDEFSKAKVYTPEEIQRDKESVERKRARIEAAHTEPRKRAKILEALLAEEIELSDWFGDSAFTIIPTEYDDFYHGVDIVTEFEKDGGYQYLALGIDITSSPTPISKKLAEIKKHITGGDLTEIKYFSSERLDIKGRMSNVPSVVIGADTRTIHQLAKLWLSAQGPRLTDKNTLTPGEMDDLRETARGAQQELAKHRIQLLVLKQIEEQLVVYKDYAEKIGKGEIAAKFEKTLTLIREIIGRKRVGTEQEKENELDDVYQSLKRALANFDSL